MTTDKVKARVKAGIAFLDALYGKVWRKKINLRKLDLEFNESCPLGQTDYDYKSHVDKLGLSDKTAFDLGFHISADGLPCDSDPAWWILTQEWKQALRRRHHATHK